MNATMTAMDPAQRALANIVYEHYDLGEVGAPQQLAHVHQRRHRKYLIDTEKGRFLLKTYHADPEILDALRFQHRLSAHLDENGLPVARIQPAFNGRKIVQVDDWALELQEWIEGHSMRVTGQSLIVSADALGLFHEVCRDFPCPERDARLWRFSEVPRDMFAKFYELAQKETRGKGELAAECNSIALFLREASNELDVNARDKFETGLIHGDWHGGNLIFQDDTLKAIVDLEFAGDGCYLEDLSYAISNLCVRTATEDKKLQQRVDLLLAYYQRHRTLAPSEERALYYAVGIKHVATVCYQGLQQGQVAGYTPAQWMEILAEQTQWLSERAHAIKKGW